MKNACNEAGFAGKIEIGGKPFAMEQVNTDGMPAIGIGIDKEVTVRGEGACQGNGDR